jgi:hypothetical protein
MLRYILAVLAIVMNIMVSAQNNEAQNELEAIRDYYGSGGLKHVRGQMVLKNVVNQQQVDKVDFEYWIKETKVFTRMNFIEILNNDSVYVMVNHQRKTIYARLTASQASAAPLFDAKQISNLLEQKGVVVKLEKKDTINILRLSGVKNSNFSSLTITYYSRDHRIKKIDADVVQGNSRGDKMTLQINYFLSESTASEIAGLFATSKYLQQSASGALSYQKKYQEYTKL